MTARPDDDALSWEGDDDATLVTGREAPARHDAGGALDDEVEATPDSGSVLPDGWRAVGRGSEAPPAARDDPPPHGDDGDSAIATSDGAPEDANAMGNAALLSIGILIGVYLLYAVGWLIGGLRLQGVARFLVSDAMYVPALVLAVAAPVVWLGTVLVSTRRSRPWIRYAWLVAGVVLLVPWPFVMMGAAG